MCGIVGYVGKKPVVPILLDGLTRLEYRGYDSAGIAWLDGENNLMRIKAEGKIQNLYLKMADIDVSKGHIGIGHTRWATHGEPNETNAHPHCDCGMNIVVVHNGIIENHRILKEDLIEKGHIFQSKTDTEVIAHLIEEKLKYSGDFLTSFIAALKEIQGSFAISCLYKNIPDRIFVARRHSPIVLGVGEEENFVASDVPAILPYTKKVIFLNDDEIAVISSNSIKIISLLSGSEIKRDIHLINWSTSMAEKGGFKHFMLKEIYEQPTSLLNTIRGRIFTSYPYLELPELSGLKDRIGNIKRIVFIACGTSLNAGLVGKYWLSNLARLPVDVEMASEFKHLPFVGDENTLYIPISQSGETADTLSALRLIKENKAPTLSICNVLGSTITRESDATLFTHAGPEIGVAATKTFTAQLAALYLIAIYFAIERNILSGEVLGKKITNFMRINQLMEDNLKDIHNQVINIADKFYRYSNFLYLGRNISYPLALEGALKLKEISYIHAEGYAAGEMKHGPIALIDKDMPVVALCPKDLTYEKMLSNIEEVRSRRGIIIAIAEEPEENSISENVIKLPEINDKDLIPFLFILPLQLLAYEIANIRGCDVDQPRNLAKSVTVE